MSYGFVYLLGNKGMPWLYKIGCTTGSPRQRAQQLSCASGVPYPFDLLLYIEVPNCKRVEVQMHTELSDFRASHKREFFCFGPKHMNWLWYVFHAHPDMASFASPDWHQYSKRPEFPADYEETWIGEEQYLHMPSNPPLDGFVVGIGV